MTLDLRIAHPCPQRWDDLAPVGGGQRWCARCERRLTDFRGMSDGEIELAHALSDTPLCGVYDEAQLRPAAASAFPPRSSLVTLALGATLLSGTAAAQSTASDRHPATVQPADASPRIDASDASPAEASTAASADTFVVRGMVRDSTGRPLGDVIVMVEGTQLRTRTDSLGAYELRLRDRRALAPTIRLRFVKLAYASRNVEVSTTSAEETRLDVTVEQSVVQIEGIMIRATAVHRGNFLVRWWKSIF